MIRVEITGDSYAEIEAQLMGFLANPSATIEPDQMGLTLEKQKLTKDEHATKQAISDIRGKEAYTLEEVRAAAMSKLDGPGFKALLSQLGAKTLTTLDPSKYGELMELINHA